MVRIKGANSDYVYTGNPEQPIQEQKDADPLYLEIFICPNDMPSRIEKHEANRYCEGNDETCPDTSPNRKSGHAKIRLDQKTGISLVTKNSIVAKGNFAVEIEPDKKLIEVTDKEITVSLGGTTIKILENGDIQLSGKKDKPVQITGNLTITGDIKVTGKVDLTQASVILSQETINQIKKS